MNLWLYDNLCTEIFFFLKWYIVKYSTTKKLIESEIVLTVVTTLIRNTREFYEILPSYHDSMD